MRFLEASLKRIDRMAQAGYEAMLPQAEGREFAPLWRSVPESVKEIFRCTAIDVLTGEFVVEHEGEEEFRNAVLALKEQS